MEIYKSYIENTDMLYTSFGSYIYVGEVGLMFIAVEKFEGGQAGTKLSTQT